MRDMLLVLATAVSTTLLASGVAVADTVTADFESFDLGTVNGQDGWTSAVPGDIPGLPNGYDQAVVLNGVAPPAFGGKSLRHSNAYNEPTGEFQFQTYSKRTTQAAGENMANTEYTAKFSFISTRPNAQQPGLRMSVSPDSGVGGRMSFIGLRDTESGIDVTFYDTPEPDGEFVGYDLGTLRRDVPHTIKFWIKLNPGPDNDLVRIYIDGVDVGQCFTTWENFYPRVPEPVPAINSLQFRSSGGEVPSLVGGGYLFDNVTVTTANGAGPAGCPADGGGPPDDIDVDKTTQTRVAQPGDLITYRITVRNRGDAPVRGLRACDRAPRALRFVSARPRLLRAAQRRRCLTIRLLRPGQRKTFLATFRLRANVLAATVTNDASAEGSGTSPPSPSPPEGAGSKPRRRQLDRDPARIRVRAAEGPCRPAAAVNRGAQASC
jgi:uncharacterized repeat protein (TIGR01451 family)